MVKNTSLIDLLKKGSISLWGYHDKCLPDLLLENHNVCIHTRDKPSTISREQSEVCFLDREIIKALLVAFPQNSRYILVRLAFRTSWLIGFFGIIRWLAQKQFIFRGILPLRSRKSWQFWVVLERRKQKKVVQQSNLSAEIGVQGLLDFLRKEDINYVVLRSFDKLPKLAREGGDLDILVADKDELRVREFLNLNQGNIPIDIYSVSGLSAGGLPYYPPPLARKILESAVEGPAGSRVPALREAFLSFAYHVLYHKGSLTEHRHMENLLLMAQKMDIFMDITLENLEEYLAGQGWRPKRDTLAKIAVMNEWVWKRFLADSSPKNEIGLGVFILKGGAVRLGFASAVVKAIERDGFAIIHKIQFNDKQKHYAADHLRGGNWIYQSSISPEDYLPAMAIVVLDRNPIKWINEQALGQVPAGRMHALKLKLRKEFDLSGQKSFIHGTDNTTEAWEYIEICFPGELALIEKKMENFKQKNGFNFLKKMHLYLRLSPYLLRHGLKRFIIKRIIER